MNAHTPPNLADLRARTKRVANFTGHKHVRLCVDFQSKMLNGGFAYKTFDFHVDVVGTFGGTIASGYVVVDNVKVPCTARLSAFRNVRLKKGEQQPIGSVTIGERSDQGGMLCPWIGEWRLVGATHLVPKE